VTLSQWLVYLESLHPEEIELGLDRIKLVAKRLAMDFSKQKVICIGGTNGKGSTATLLSSILQTAGNNVGLYTSPHLLNYNERICVNNIPLSDDELCAAFVQVEQAREGTQLTYFEFGTLAALLLFSQQALDYIVLEVGLGGRLDAVNILDTDLSIITNVALDHIDWLGDNRELIGYEKAGIFKAGCPALYGENDIPDSVLATADDIGAFLFRKGLTYDWHYEDANDSWSWQGRDSDGGRRVLKDLPISGFSLNYSLDNVALVLQAITLLDQSINQQQIVSGLKQASLAGRFQLINRNSHTLVLDVAHNVHAAEKLLSNLKLAYPGRTIKIVIAMLADKDIPKFLSILSPVASKWYVAEIKEDRGSPAKILYNHLQEMNESSLSCFDNIEAAFKAAENEVTKISATSTDDVVLVTGSFYTVSSVMELI
jgi:dihydrofolate synthase / folylpolyglutamate synthase